MTYAVSFYDVVLFFHILAVVLAFGPTYAYGVFAATAERMDPRAVPAVTAGILVWNRVTQGLLLVILLAGIYLVADGDWDLSEFYISWGFVAVIFTGGMSGAYFQPKTEQLKTLAERDIAAAGDGPVTLGSEFQALNAQIAKAGMFTGLVVALTIYVMTAKPFL